MQLPVDSCSGSPVFCEIQVFASDFLEVVMV
jgi:hypothetical protein